MANYPKRLIEVDLPIRVLSDLRGRRTQDQDVDVRRPGIWWSRKPQHQCRSICLAALLPDPADPHMSENDRVALRELLRRYGLLSREGALSSLALRSDLLSLCAYLADPEAAMASLAGSLIPNLADMFQFSSQIALDPFSGSGAIPVEAQRLGLNTFAGEYNPLASLYLKYLMEWGRRIDEHDALAISEQLNSRLVKVYKTLGRLFPTHPDFGRPFGYIRFRQLVCEGPGCGCVVPATSKFELDCRNHVGVIFTSQPKPHMPITVKLKTQPTNGFPKPTISSGALVCPACHFKTTRKKVMQQGAREVKPSILVAVVYLGKSGLHLAAPTPEQIEAEERAEAFIKTEGLESFIPAEEWPKTEMRRFSPPLYGLKRFADCHTSRQRAFLGLLCRSLSEYGKQRHSEIEAGLATLLVGKAVENNTAFCRWRNDRGGSVEGTFAGKSVGMIWDFFETNPCHPDHALQEHLRDLLAGLRAGKNHLRGEGTVLNGAVQHLSLPDDSVDLLYTDPPYYDSVPYSHLSDWLFVWMKAVGVLAPLSGPDGLVPKAHEIVVDRPHSKSPTTHDGTYFRREMQVGLGRCHSLLKHDGIGIIVFAHLKTSAWESLLEALLEAGFQVTASWPVETERGGRLQAQNTASLQSSIHLVVRPRKGDRDSHNQKIGDWREVLHQLPIRIKEWLPRLAAEGVVGADAIFACLGPALEIFSQYSRVEKASGELMSLKVYLQFVWAAVAQEALKMVFEGADATVFEEDSLLTAMWLWTLSTGAKRKNVAQGEDVESEVDFADEEGDDTHGKSLKASNYVLEYDAARKIAQGLGAHLEELTSVIEVLGDKARLLGVAERTRKLFGKDAADAPGGKRGKKHTKQGELFRSIEEIETEEGGWGEKGVPKLGETVLDRVHQSMILFAAGRSEAIKRFLVEEGVGRDGRFWKLAQALSALYPPGTDEKRWVDGVLARKKGLGF